MISCSLRVSQVICCQKTSLCICYNQQCNNLIIQNGLILNSNSNMKYDEILIVNIISCNKVYILTVIFNKVMKMQQL